ncbi:MAG: FAD-binding protein, partial [Gammaproteobacteria bacterium]
MSSERAVRRFQETILDAANSGKKLRVRGGDTKRTIYPSINDEANKGAGSLLVDYSGFVSYQAAELVLTVRAGTALTEIETELAAKNQKLGFEPPGFGAGATIGGTVAAALSGSARPYAGSVRDAVLGVKVLSGAGKIARFGGEVMKNVAGYDVSRLLVGSMGSLGVLLEVSLRTTPVPNAESFWTLACDEAEAFRQMATFNRASLPISGLAFN